MSVIEAKIGGVPWGMVDEDNIIAELADGNGYPRPDGVFTDRERTLVQAMIEFDPVQRMDLAQVIKVLADLSGEEDVAKTKWDVESTGDEKLERIRDYIQHLLTKSQKVRFVLLSLFRHEKLSLEQSEQKRAQWVENGLKTFLCDDCSSENPIENQFCCECGAATAALFGRDEAASRFADMTMDRETLQDVISVFEDQMLKADEAERQLLQSIECSVCSEWILPGDRAYGDCGSTLDAENRLETNKQLLCLTLLKKTSKLKNKLAHLKKGDELLA